LSAEGEQPPIAGGTVWITGLSGSGKTTLAQAVSQELSARGQPNCVLDGDELRRGLSSDLGLSHEDRSEQARRAAHVARLIARAGIVAIVALVSPYAEDRALARETHAGLEFLEVWVDTPLSVCQERDPKGLYRRSRSGELSGLTGVDSPYEAPTAPDVTVQGYGATPAAAASEVIDALEAQRTLPRGQAPASRG
jgi:bifunctional enzyme CysN/CysC